MRVLDAGAWGTQRDFFGNREMILRVSMHKKQALF
jgi:hypothetical protein